MANKREDSGFCLTPSCLISETFNFFLAEKTKGPEMKKNLINFFTAYGKGGW